MERNLSPFPKFMEFAGSLSGEQTRHVRDTESIARFAETLLLDPIARGKYKDMGPERAKPKIEEMRKKWDEKVQPGFEALETWAKLDRELDRIPGGKEYDERLR